MLFVPQKYYIFVLNIIVKTYQLNSCYEISLTEIQIDNSLRKIKIDIELSFFAISEEKVWRYKIGWVVKKEGKEEKVAGSIPPVNKN